MKIYDTFMFFNELDLLEIRLNTLYPHVDYFVITEAAVTFSGKPKPFLYYENRMRFKKFEKKIIYNRIDFTPNDFSDWIPPNNYFTDRNISFPHKHKGLPLKSLNISRQREVYQKDSNVIPLVKMAADNDIILYSDLDEIPNPKILLNIDAFVKNGSLYHFNQRWYIYYLNVFCDIEWFGTRACRFNYLRDRNFSVDLIRYHTVDRRQQRGEIVENGGWHFSFLGGPEKVQEKLNALAPRRSRYLAFFLNLLVRERIKKKIEKNKDAFFRGRKFVTVPIDQSFPAYLVANQDRFRELIK